jgi:rubrerythrin
MKGSTARSVLINGRKKMTVETTVTGIYCYPEYNFPITLYECDECGAVFLDRDDDYKYCPYCGRKIVDEKE